MKYFFVLLFLLPRVDIDDNVSILNFHGTIPWNSVY